MTALERGCAGAKPSDDAPAGYLQNRAAQRERGAGLARPDARPGKCQEGCGNNCSFDQRPFATRDHRYDPSVEPRPGGDVLANHLRPHVCKPEDEHRHERASRQGACVCAGLERCADHGRHQERAVHSRSIADVSPAVDRSHVAYALLNPVMVSSRVKRRGVSGRHAIHVIALANHAKRMTTRHPAVVESPGPAP